MDDGNVCIEHIIYNAFGSYAAAFEQATRVSLHFRHNERKGHKLTVKARWGG